MKFTLHETISETIGRFEVLYEYRGDPEEQIRQVEASLKEPASDVLKRRLREEDNRWSLEMRGRPCGYFTDFANTLDEARNKAREIEKKHRKAPNRKGQT